MRNVVHVKLKGRGMLRETNEENVAVPEPSPDYIFALDTQKKPHAFIVEQQMVLVPVESIIAVEILVGLTSDLDR